MADKTPKTDWLRISQFAIFCISCVLAIVLWYFAQQGAMADAIEEKYVSKTELQIVAQRMNMLETTMKEMKGEFSQKLLKVEESNEEILDLVTDIRLSLAGIK
jgi:hypothetical protein